MCHALFNPQRYFLSYFLDFNVILLFFLFITSVENSMNGKNEVYEVNGFVCI